MRIGLPSDLTNLDGHTLQNPAIDVIWMCFERLVEFDSKLQPQPVLAESWEQSADGKQLKLNLRKEVQFHSGRELTSDDVKWNMERSHDPKAGNGGLAAPAQPLKTVDTPDKYTVIMSSDRPWPAVFNFLEVLHILDPQADATTKPVGTGPFTFVEWVQGDHLSFAKNKNYWQSGKPYLDQIVVPVFRDLPSMTAQLEAGAIDVADAIQIQDAVRLQKDPKYQVVVNQHSGSYLAFVANTAAAPMDNEQLRQALAYSIDRQRIVDTALLGYGSPKDLPFGPDSPAFDPAKMSFYSLDLDKAKSILSAAGLSNVEFDIVYRVNVAEYGTIAQIVQSDLAKIGVKANLKPLDPTTFLNTVVLNHNYQGIQISNGFSGNWPVAGIPTDFFWSPTGNPASYRDDDYAQIANAVSMEVDPAKQKALYGQYSDVILQTAFDLPFSAFPQKLVARTNVQGLTYTVHETPSFVDCWLSA